MELAGMFPKCSLFLNVGMWVEKNLAVFPFVFNKIRVQALVAQWKEQRFPKPQVAGPIPAEGAR
jgi:hypothetical protein